MTPSRFEPRFRSATAPRRSSSARALSVLSAIILFTSAGCYTKLATSEGDRWGYSGPVKQKVVVRETDDTIVVRETRVIHQPQPVMTDTVTYTNTSTGEDNVVVNNYFTPPPATFGTYDPWSNSYPTWYDDYWYQPRAAVVITIGDPYYHSRWFDRHWRRYSYYDPYWGYNYNDPWYGGYHISYRAPGWAYYDPYYPYPPLYGYGYGCYAPTYDPYYWPHYGYGYGGYGGGYYDGHYGYGNHGYYGNNNDHDDHGGRERKHGNVGGEERGRGGVTTDGGSTGSKTGIVLSGDARVNANTAIGGRVTATPASTGSTTSIESDNGAISANGRVKSSSSINENANVSIDENASSSIYDSPRSTRVGNVDISTGEIPMGSSTNTTPRDLRNSPSQGAPNVYNGPGRTSTSWSSSSSNATPSNATPSNGSRSNSTPIERKSSETIYTPRTSTSTSTNSVKNIDVSDPGRSSSTTSSTPRSNNSSARSSSTPRNTAPTQSPSYTPRSSSSSSGSYSGGRASGSSSSAGNASGSSSRSGGSRSSDSRSNSDGGSRGRR